MKYAHSFSFSLVFSSVGQMTALTGTIEANAGPLSAAFQQRVKYALYLIIAAVVFGFFAGTCSVVI